MYIIIYSLQKQLHTVNYFYKEYYICFTFDAFVTILKFSIRSITIFIVFRKIKTYHFMKNTSWQWVSLPETDKTNKLFSIIIIIQIRGIKNAKYIRKINGIILLFSNELFLCFPRGGDLFCITWAIGTAKDIIYYYTRTINTHSVLAKVKICKLVFLILPTHLIGIILPAIITLDIIMILVDPVSVILNVYTSLTSNTHEGDVNNIMEIRELFRISEYNYYYTSTYIYGRY